MEHFGEFLRGETVALIRSILSGIMMVLLITMVAAFLRPRR